MLKLSDIHELIRLLDDSSLSELSLEYEDVKLLLKKSSGETYIAQPVSVQAQSAPQPAPAAASAPAAPQPTPAADDANMHIVTSPMVGTFYRAPSPDAPSFVELGSQVTPKTVICIVEAMKLMNEIEAEVSGEIVEVLAKNGDLVEYGQPLFKIKLT
ncbi:acetyl-CoA carboxylase biotin carboxyl carrier protein [Alicyclobacillus acidiphilus]|uniref:acetyl-CoA carboxylase biotin carboxyl carrier protein n=1 Tax=Alicyclobacillus acidiphilus TaxID=182455 RepID=UPI00082A4942|nr:acetyl-CoA carboxylase biotin carboxyl carrier protein [Alicyclobacillus acidiphilus]